MVEKSPGWLPFDSGNPARWKICNNVQQENIHWWDAWQDSIPIGREQPVCQEA
jgi:hypothetical protein